MTVIHQDQWSKNQYSLALRNVRLDEAGHAPDRLLLRLGSSLMKTSSAFGLISFGLLSSRGRRFCWIEPFCWQFDSRWWLFQGSSCQLDRWRGRSLWFCQTLSSQARLYALDSPGGQISKKPGSYLPLPLNPTRSKKHLRHSLHRAEIPLEL